MNNFREVNDDILRDWLSFREEMVLGTLTKEDRKHYIYFDEICESIEADTLAYLHMDRLKELNEGLPYCDACFSGNYPIDPPTQDIRGEQG